MRSGKPAAKLHAGPYVKSTIAEINALGDAGKLEEAEAKARQLYGEFPDRADVNDTLSLTLVDQIKLGLALPFAEFAMNKEPRNPAYLVNLGRLYLELEIVEDALPVLERAMACKPTPFQAPWAIAGFYHDTGQAERALPYFEKALATADPLSARQILVDQLDSHASLGHLEEADKAADRLAKTEQLESVSTIRRASLRKHKTDSAVFEELKSLLQNPKLSPEDRVMALLELGKIHENTGQYDDAFECFGRSKSERAWKGSLAAFEAEVDANIKTFSPEVFATYSGFGSTSETPVFVVGMPRSGTTLTEQIIGAHPSAGGVGELKRIGSLYRGFARNDHPDDLFKVMNRVGPGKWLDVPETYLRLLNLLAPGKRRVVDKMPHNFTMAGFISLCFPKARIVHVHRHPVDNFISAYQSQMNEHHGYSFDQVAYAKYYLQYERQMAHWNAVLPGRIFDLNYDLLVQDPEPIARQMIEFIGLEWSDECLRFHEKQTTVRTFSRHQVRSAVNANSLARWRNYQKHLGPMLEILGNR